MTRDAVAGSEPKHCDDYIRDYHAPKCLRLFILIHRLPALEMALCHECGIKPKLFATHEGKRVRIVVASRLGDLGITSNLEAENGYEMRVMADDLTDFGDTP